MPCQLVKGSDNKWRFDYGKHKGETLAKASTSYLQWTLDNVEVTPPAAKRAITNLVRLRGQGRAEMDHDPDCTCWGCRQQKMFEDAGLYDMFPQD